MLKEKLSERIEKAIEFAKKQRDFQRQQFERNGGKKPYERLGIVNAMQNIINILEGRKENYNK